VLRLRPRLTPPEAWFAALMLRRQQTHRTPPILRLEQNYGPDGMVLFASALLWGCCEVSVGPPFFVFIVASGGRSVMTDVLLGLSFVLFCLTLFRLRQTVRAGRTFRGNRPFIKRKVL
jgi:hypothetical protein